MDPPLKIWVKLSKPNLIIRLKNINYEQNSCCQLVRFRFTPCTDTMVSRKLCSQSV